MTAEQTHKNESTATDKPNLSIVIDHYTSDGPGFFGKIEFHIDGNRLTQICFANRIGQSHPDEDIETFELPVNIGQVVAVHNSSRIYQ